MTCLQRCKSQEWLRTDPKKKTFLFIRYPQKSGEGGGSKDVCGHDRKRRLLHLPYKVNKLLALITFLKAIAFFIKCYSLSKVRKALECSYGNQRFKKGFPYSCSLDVWIQEQFCYCFFSCKSKYIHVSPTALSVFQKSLLWLIELFT